MAQIHDYSDVSVPDGSPMGDTSDLNVADSLPPDSELARSVDHGRIEAAVREILAAIGEDPDREGVADTPARVARMYAETCAGLHEDPQRHLKVTFDAGHAISSEHAARGECTALDYLDRAADYVYEAHMYGKEEQDRHHPIRSAEDIQPIVNRLAETGCRWWTIELDDYEQALETREILRSCLRARKAR